MLKINQKIHLSETSQNLIIAVVLSMLLLGKNKMLDKMKIRKFIIFVYLGGMNFLLLLEMLDILLASPKFYISLIYYGELFVTLSISQDGIIILFFYYLFVCSNTIVGFVLYKSRYIVFLLIFQVLYFLFFLAGIYFNILSIRH